MLVFVACVTSTDRRIEQSVLEHQQQIDKLEARNRDLEQRLIRYDNAITSGIRELEGIRERSKGMAGEVDEIINLFVQYQLAVERLIRNYLNASTQTGG
jgi:chromosome segregation ATPase